MRLIEILSARLTMIIPVLAGLWLLLFVVTYLRSRQAHQGLNKHLRELRKRLDMDLAQGELAVLAGVQRAVESSDHKTIGRIIERLRVAADEVSEADVRLFDRRWDFLRTLIEIFPVLGILGTVCSMAVSADSGAGEASDRLAQVMSSFGNAMSSTIAGLLCAVTALALFGFYARKVEQWLSDLRDFRVLVERAEHLNKP